MLLEVGQESDIVLTKSPLSKYQCHTYIDQANLVMDNLDAINCRNSDMTTPFS